MGDVGEGEAKDRQVCLVCQQPSPEERNFSESIPSIPNVLPLSLKMSCGLHTETLHDLACGKRADDAPDYIQVMEATEVAATSQSQAAHTLGNHKLSGWRRGQKTYVMCVPAVLLFSWKKKSDTSGLCLPSSRSFARI